MSVSPSASGVSQYIDIAVYLQQEVGLDVRAVELLGAHGPRKFLGEFPVQDIFVVPHRKLRKLLQGGRGGGVFGSHNNFTESWR